MKIAFILICFLPSRNKIESITYIWLFWNVLIMDILKNEVYYDAIIDNWRHPIL